MKLNRNSIVMCACIFIRLHLVSSQTYDEAVTVLRNKTFFYEKSIRPVTNQSSTLIVHINFDLVSIQDFDEVQESLTVIGGLTLTWTDDFIKWNPADYGGMVDIVSESGKFWTPYLILTNNVNKLDKVGESWQRIRFTNEGVAKVVQADTWSTLCKADVMYYPWDDHWCGFEFASVAYKPDEMTLQPGSDKISTHYYIESGAWELLGSDIQHDWSISRDSKVERAMHTRDEEDAEFGNFRVCLYSYSSAAATRDGTGQDRRERKEKKKWKA
ncbi:acetylcholine receptor subunit alpha-type acr-16-like [Mercenaria mercenaria]|uniref:acetylcholine receptor subunit alpha-type acr-16-like n=1 Tax=Mercenaria mercenaria TaxID=6596 RepID=UPI001E1D52E9|nr:acetylcholine receptor subunit alpha-type acr-16-like [Mercenaria mercenaria]